MNQSIFSGLKEQNLMLNWKVVEIESKPTIEGKRNWHNKLTPPPPNNNLFEYFNGDQIAKWKIVHIEL